MDSTKHERLLRAFLVVAQLVRVVSSWDASFTTSHVGRGVLRPTLARRWTSDACSGRRGSNVPRGTCRSNIACEAPTSMWIEHDQVIDMLMW